MLPMLVALVVVDNVDDNHVTSGSLFVSLSVTLSFSLALLRMLVYLLVLTRVGLSRRVAFAFCLLLYFYYIHSFRTSTRFWSHTHTHTHPSVCPHMSAKIVYASLFYSICLIFASGFFCGFSFDGLFWIYCELYAKFWPFDDHVSNISIEKCCKNAYKIWDGFAPKWL